MRVKINSIAYHLPSNEEGLETLTDENPEWDIDKITEKTGIFKRFISSPNETATDLAYVAATKLIKSLDAPNNIDLLILVTQSPDYTIPTSACILQDRLNLSKNCMAFDVNLGCSGFVYALSVAGSLIDSGVAQKGLIICSDTYTKYINKNDRTCRPIFSDGAAAILLEASNNNDIGPFDFGTDGSGYEHLIVRDSGLRKNINLNNNSIMNLEMAGSEIFLFTLREVPKSIERLMLRTGITLDDIDLVIFHQASKLVIDSLIKSVNIPKSKVFNNLHQIGNTVSASIPIALSNAESQKKLKSGDLVLLVGFGVGLSWGSTTIRWKQK